jgi:hypothetical protein
MGFLSPFLLLARIAQDVNSNKDWSDYSPK